MFYYSQKSYLYGNSPIHPKSIISEYHQDPQGKFRYDLPLCCDTEFQDLTYTYPEMAPKLGKTSLTLTVQVRGFEATDTPQIYSHWDTEKLGLPLHFPTMKGSSVAETYLDSLGIPCKVKPERGRYITALAKKRHIKLVLYCHFAVADLTRLFDGELRENVLDLCRPQRGGYAKNQIDQTRRLTTVYEVKTKEGETIRKDYCKLNYVLEMGGIDFALSLKIVDTCALHGIAGLIDISENVGIPMKNKQDYTKTEKGQMLKQYLKADSRFRDYSLGDVIIPDILAKNRDKFSEIYRRLGISEYYQDPRLTIGATVRDIFKSKLRSHLEESLGYPFKEKDFAEFVETFVLPGSAQVLRERESTTGGLNSKVLGGRCFNNSPRKIQWEGVILDSDLGGCYAASMRSQLYPVGNPVIVEYPKHAKNNDQISLGSFLKKYRKELVSGLWQVWFSCADLPQDQDFFSSYKPPKLWASCGNDTEDSVLAETGLWLERPDETKIFSREISLGLLNQDGLDWIEYVASPKLRKHILEKSTIYTGMFYPQSERVDNVGDLLERYEAHTAYNSCDVSTAKGGTVVTSVDRQFRGWYAVDMGELLIDQLLIERGKHPKKTPLNVLFKLIANTAYGVSVSRFFDISNCLVGSNITGRVRSAIWYFEKACNAALSITDGGFWNTNKVIHPKKKKQRVMPQDMVQICRKSGKELNSKMITLAPIGGYKSIQWEIGGISFDGELLTTSQAKDRIDSLIKNHILKVFPHPKIAVLRSEASRIVIKDGKHEYIPMIGQFIFESKDFCKKAFSHGQSNYGMFDGENTISIAMRSYRKGGIEDFHSETMVAGEFFKALESNPHNVPRQPPYRKRKIVKVGEYRKRYNSFYQHRSIFPGDTLINVSIFKEFSISTFCFQTQKQRDLWAKYTDRLKLKYNQSIERFFIRGDGSLDYQRMIEVCDQAISEGCNDFQQWIDRGFNTKNLFHPSSEELDKLKAQLAEIGLFNADDLIQNVKDEFPYESLFCESEEASFEDVEDLDF